jgi:hypothetical protein
MDIQLQFFMAEFIGRSGRLSVFSKIDEFLSIARSDWGRRNIADAVFVRNASETCCDGRKLDN